MKLAVTRILLEVRQSFPDLFAHGSYTPAATVGTFDNCVIAFQREWKQQSFVAIVPRLTARIGVPPTGAKWKDTVVVFSVIGEMRDLFTGAVINAKNEMRLTDVLREFPFALLMPANA